MITVISQSTQERKEETRKLFELIRPLLDEGYGYIVSIQEKAEKGKGDMSEEGIDLKYYINVYDLMMLDLPRPKLKPTVIATPEEWLPIIGVETEV